MGEQTSTSAADMGSMTLNADSLELPEAVKTAWRQDGIRIIVQYTVNEDAFVARFDTKIDGVQYNCAWSANVSWLHNHHFGKAEEWARSLLPRARQNFFNGDCARGRIIWYVERFGAH